MAQNGPDQVGIGRRARGEYGGQGDHVRAGLLRARTIALARRAVTGGTTVGVVLRPGRDGGKRVRTSFCKSRYSRGLSSAAAARWRAVGAARNAVVPGLGGFTRRPARGQRRCRHLAAGALVPRRIVTRTPFVTQWRLRAAMVAVGAIAARITAVRNSSVRTTRRTHGTARTGHRLVRVKGRPRPTRCPAPNRSPFA